MTTDNSSSSSSSIFFHGRRPVVWSVRLRLLLVSVFLGATLLVIQQQPTATTAARLTTTKTSPRSAPPSVNFVFVIGIEGTGHHLVSSLYRKSPTFRQVFRDFDMEGDMMTLHEDLYPMGLWDGACHKKIHGGPNVSQVINVQEKYQSFVQHLQETEDKVIQKAAVTQAAKGGTVSGDNNNNIHLLLNAIVLHGTNGMLSFPTDKGDCRALHYPDIDQLYMACTEAGVTCAHVYLYRDPYQVIRSTNTKRGFNPDVLVATKLYYSMLNIIYTQLLMYPHLTLGCWGFYPSSLEEESKLKEEVWDGVRDLFGWSARNQTAFDLVLDGTYTPPKVPDQEELESVVPANQDIYMKSMILAHDRTLELCRKQVRSIAGKKGTT